MIVDVEPRQAEILPVVPVTVSISVSNTSTVIGGYIIRILGADPSWVDIETDRLSLFPDESRTVRATITTPRGLAAGVRRIAVQVRELTPPFTNSIDEIDLNVPTSHNVAMRLDPLAVTGGRKAGFSVLVENTGNTVLSAQPAGEDLEGKVAFRFEPDQLRLAPGEHAVLDLRLKARRKFIGAPTARTFNLYLDDVPKDAFFAQEPPPSDMPTTHEDKDALATGTFLQRAVVARGSISLFGLLTALTVFALVITVALSRLVGQSAADRDLALQIAAARNASDHSGTSGLSGTVRSISTGNPIPGVSVLVFAASNTTTAVATTATDSKGVYSVTNLGQGDYDVEFRGAGLLQVWYPAATSVADAGKITLAANHIQAGVDVKLGGSPATISGTVTGDDVSAATLFLETLGTGTTGATVGSQPLSPGTNTPPDDGSAIVQTVAIGADGAFTLANVVSPATYKLVVVKTGYATAQQEIDVGAGETRGGVTIALTKGDGVIGGTVTSGSGPLTDATITATSGQTAVNTVSDATGAFSLRLLPTPGSYTVVASKQGFASQTLTVNLASAQQVTGLAITLSSSSGELDGSVLLQRPHQSDAAATGVAVTVTDGQLSVQTETDTTKTPGAWRIRGLPIPGTYTVTFSRADLATQIVSVSLDAVGTVTPSSRGATIEPDGTISVRLKSASAVVYGTVFQKSGATVCDNATNALGEASVSLESGSTTYQVTTATASPNCGMYRIENIPPGTYTITADIGSGTTPKSRVITLAAGDLQPESFTLRQPASLSGSVVTNTGDELCGWTVDLFQQDQYPGKAFATTVTAGSNSNCGSRLGDGSFSFSDIPAGTYIVSVGPAPDNPTATRQIVVAPSQAQTVTVEVFQ